MDENTILDHDFGNVVEPRVVDADTEAELRIISVRVDTDKNGYPYMMPFFEVASDDYAKEFSHFIRLPHEEQSAKEMNKTKYRLKTFYDAFGVDYSRGVNPVDDLPGKTGWAILGMRESDFTGEEENYVKRFIAGR
jgi:hypothetical protein